MQQKGMILYLIICIFTLLKTILNYEKNKFSFKWFYFNEYTFIEY